MLRISQTLMDGMVTHARADHPDEACGVIGGPEGSDTPVRLIPMINADRSPTFFRFDPSEQLAVAKQMWDDDEEIVVVYHSHTATEAYPSRTDVSYAAEPQAHYVLVSTAGSGREPGPVSVRSFRILDGTVTEEEIELVADVADMVDPD
ncbi:MAG: Mov34/MPN/PAD-1 family protein [Janthinobacterium lividum]